MSTSKIHQSGSNVVSSYKSSTNRAEISVEVPSPSSNERGLSASVSVTPTYVHQRGLIPVCSKDATFNVQENISTQLSTTIGNDGGLTIANVTPMEDCQARESLDTSQNKVIEIHFD